MKWMVFMLPISFQFYAVAARQKAVRQVLKRYFKDYCEILTALIQHGIDRGEFRPMQSEDVAIAITALYEGIALLWMVDPDATTWEQIGERSLLMLLEGLAVAR